MTTIPSSEVMHRLNWLIACEGTDQYAKALADFRAAVQGWL